MKAIEIHKTTPFQEKNRVEIHSTLWLGDAKTNDLDNH